MLLLFVTVPLVELFLLVRIGEAIGLAPTIVLVLATGALGAVLARAQGLATWGRFQGALAAGRLPGRELIEGLLILVAGAVLLTPGVLTDAVGFLLLTPPLRRRVIAVLGRRFEARLAAPRSVPSSGAEAPSADPAGSGPAIDVDYEIRD